MNEDCEGEEAEEDASPPHGFAANLPQSPPALFPMLPALLPHPAPPPPPPPCPPSLSSLAPSLPPIALQLPLLPSCPCPYP